MLVADQDIKYTPISMFKSMYQTNLYRESSISIGTMAIFSCSIQLLKKTIPEVIETKTVQQKLHFTQHWRGSADRFTLHCALTIHAETRQARSISLYAYVLCGDVNYGLKICNGSASISEEHAF